MLLRVAVIWLSLKAHQLRVDVIEAFGGLGQKFTQQLIHERLVPPATGADGLQNPLRPRTPLKGRGSLLPKRLISVAE
jgi:hypothetical protein